MSESWSRVVDICGHEEGKALSGWILPPPPPPPPAEIGMIRGEGNQEAH